MPMLRQFGKSKQEIAILKPEEMKQLLKHIPKYKHQIQIKALLYSGARYVELKRLYNNPEWFDGKFIKLNAGKPQAQMTQRYIHLNPQGREVISSFINLKSNLPSYATMDENIKRWCNKGGIDSKGVCSKSFRKTWESWLVYYYPYLQMSIMMSQGHTSTTSITHYLNLAFTEEDKIYMREFVDNWS